MEERSDTIRVDSRLVLHDTHTTLRPLGRTLTCRKRARPCLLGESAKARHRGHVSPCERPACGRGRALGRHAAGTGAKATENDGYIGCSMTVNSINGYRTEGGTRFWPTPGYRIGGGILGRWSDTASAWWTEYNQQVAGFGAPPRSFSWSAPARTGPESRTRS